MFCKECGLFGGELIAVDGTKFRADNSKRNSYNQKKIDRQLKYIEEKIETLKQRQNFYKNLHEKLEKSEDNEISTTDPDSRMMDNKKNGLEVNYNAQIAVDAKKKINCCK